MKDESLLDLRQELSALPLTEGMRSSDIDQLARIAEFKIYPAGRILFTESERHGRIHIVCDGLVALEMRVPGHGVQRILTVGRGELLAWSALLADGIMTSTAVAIQPTRAIEFVTVDLKSICEANHQLGFCVMRQVAGALARRLLATRLQLLDLFRN